MIVTYLSVRKQVAVFNDSSKSATCVLLVAMLSVVTVTAHASALRAAPPLSSPWPPELGEAFDLYHAGEFLETERLCRQLGVQAYDERLRREFAALSAMATMRLPGRTNRLGGRARLAELAKDDPSLLTRPECQLAYGIAQTALNETASAIHHLSLAAKSFAERGQSARLAETYVALAQAWAEHGEWQSPISEARIARPESPAEAERIRRQQIRELRRLVSAMPNGEAYATRIDLILAQHLLQRPDGAAEGLALLEDIARRREETPATAKACLMLGERYEELHRWDEAARLYERVKLEDLGAVSREAGRHLDAIQQPQLVLDVPEQVGVGERVVVDLRARNLTDVELEVRQVDLAEWLERRQGRFAEGALPNSGALVSARELRTAAGAEHDWWRSGTLGEPLAFTAPIGAVVVSACADAGGRELTTNRLVIASDLRAAVFASDREAAIWATWDESADRTARQSTPQARFWMYGSFVPTRPRFSGNVAVFTLPPEARLLRDKRWVCLVECGEQVALCQGKLRENPGSEVAVALVGGPPTPRVGDQFRLFGLLLGESGDSKSQAVQIELTDELDQVINSTNAPVSESRTFSMQLPVSAKMAGDDLQVAARLDGRVLASVFSAPPLWVKPTDQSSLRFRCDLPRCLPADTTSITVGIEAAYPWGSRLSGGVAGARLRAARLATAQPRHEEAFSFVLRDRLDLNSTGRAEIVRALADFDLPAGPLAVRLSVEGSGWDGRIGGTWAETLVSAEPVHVWLDCETDSPRVGEPLRVSVGWFDPSGRALGGTPTLDIRCDGCTVAQPRLLPGLFGMRSELWRPTTPGEYELVVTLPLDDGAPAIVRETIEVTADAAADGQDSGPLSFEAHAVLLEGTPQARIQLDGQRLQPTLVLLEAGGTLAAREVPALNGASEVLLPLPERNRGEARVILAESGSKRVQVLGVTDVLPDREDAVKLVLDHGGGEITSGAATEVTVTCLRNEQPVRGATIVARLADCSQSGGVQWIPGQERPDLTSIPGGVEVTSSVASRERIGDSEEGSDVIPETRELRAEMAQALFEGQSTWVSCQPTTEGATAFAVPLPSAPGFYRLVVAAFTTDGGCAVETLDLDTRRGITVEADVPDHLTIGDRSVATLAVTNTKPFETRVRVTLDGGPGLHHDNLRLLDNETGKSEPVGDDGSLSFVLGALDSGIVQAEVEATQPGKGAATFVAETTEGRHVANVSYSVRARSAGAGETREAAVPPDRIELRRSLFLLERDEEAAGNKHALPAGADQSQPDEWLRFEVEPGERIPLGRLVLVREEFLLDHPLGQVEWRQRIPGNGCTHAGDWSDLRQIGKRSELGLQTLAYEAARLKTGRQYLQEYVIVPMRPGSCWFPTPEVNAAGLVIPVEVEAQARTMLISEHE